MNKTFKLEISKTILTIIIGGLFSLATISISTIYNSNKTLIEKYSTKLDILEEREFNVSNFIKSVENTDHIPELSMKRVQILMDSINLSQDKILNEKDVNKYLGVSSNSRLSIKNSIGIIDSQLDIDGPYSSNIELNKTLKNLLDAEKQTWFAVDNYLLNFEKDNWRANELLFKQIDYNLLNYHEYQNKYSAIFSKMVIKKDEFTRIKKKENDNFDMSIKELKLIRSINIIGLLLSILILIPLLIMAYKQFKKR